MKWSQWKWEREETRALKLWGCNVAGRVALPVGVKNYDPLVVFVETLTIINHPRQRDSLTSSILLGCWAALGSLFFHVHLKKSRIVHTNASNAWMYLLLWLTRQPLSASRVCRASKVPAPKSFIRTSELRWPSDTLRQTQVRHVYNYRRSITTWWYCTVHRLPPLSYLALLTSTMVVNAISSTRNAISLAFPPDRILLKCLLYETSASRNWLPLQKPS